jgi:hypothetical protein
MAGDLTFMEHKVKSTRRIEVVIFDRDIRRCIKNKDYKGLLKWVINYKGYWKFIPLYDRKIFARVSKKLVRDLSAKFTKRDAA